MKFNRKSFIVYYTILGVMMAAAVAMFIFSAVKKNNEFLICSAVCGAITVIGGAVFWIIYRNFIRSQVMDAALSVENEFDDRIDQWHQPMLYLSQDCTVSWCNKAMKDLVDGRDLSGIHVDDLGLGLEGREGRRGWETVSKTIEFKERFYTATMRKVKINEKNYGIDEREYSKAYSVILDDITEKTLLEKENNDLKPVVAIVCIDNYDQTFGDMEDTQKALLEAFVYRSISGFSAELEGVLVKLERDRFIISFHNKFLRILKEKKFPVLEEVKKYSFGNQYPVTLSIGVGTGMSLFEAREAAKDALEIAFGRGGDQAVIKTPGGQQFFGGTTSGTQENTRVRARHCASALKEIFGENDRIIVMGHKNSDLDSLGAAVGICTAAIAFGKTAQIVLDDNHPAVADLYIRMKSDAKYGELIISPQQAVNVCKEEKVLLVIVDVSRPVIMQAPELLDVCNMYGVIDHHRASEDSVKGGAIQYVEPKASSTSEMVTELIQYMTDKPKLTRIEADALFAGIALDTKNFTIKTGVRTFEAAAFLRKQGADSVRVREMFKNRLDEEKAKAYIVSNAELYGGSKAIAAWESELENAQTLAAAAADELLDVAGVKSSFVLTKIGQTVAISARSLGKLNVQLVMEQLGGGGHLTVAGAQLKDVELADAKSRLIEAINYVESQNQ